MEPQGVYQVDRIYPVTEVLTWWLAKDGQAPEWTPVMGNLHDDAEVFGVPERHFHVDPRFLDARRNRRAIENLHDYGCTTTGPGEKCSWQANEWHPSFTEIASHFPWTDENGRPFCYTINHVQTQVKDLDTRKPIWKESVKWGLDRIQHRTRKLRCQREMPPATVCNTTPAQMDFRELRGQYPDAYGDICPHRGFDLRNIPIEPDGCRQCPLHQLRVRAPGCNAAR